MSTSATQWQNEVENIVEEQLKQVKSSADLDFGDRISHFETPGISVAVIDEGQIAWCAGYGVLQQGKPDRVTPETRFQAGSINKPVVALAALRMVEAGLMGLDENVNDRLKSWRIPSVNGWQPPITPRMLLSHSSGLGTRSFRGYRTWDEIPSLAEILEGTDIKVNSDPVRVVNFPNMTYSYSGGGYALLQLWLEDVMGDNLMSLMQSWVLDPLGMKHSSFAQPPSDDFVAECASGHYYDGQPIHGGWHIYSAGLWTTPSDLAEFALALQAAYRGEHSVISKQVANWILTPHIPNPAEDKHHSLGLEIHDLDGVQCFSHSGGTAGYLCQLTATIEDGKGYVIMTNAESGWTWAFIGWFSRAIEQVYHWQAEKTNPIQTFAKVDPAMIGTYHVGEQTLSVQMDGDDVSLQLSDQTAILLIQTADTTFQVKELTTTIRFINADHEYPRRLLIEQAGQTLMAFAD